MDTSPCRVDQDGAIEITRGVGGGGWGRDGGDQATISLTLLRALKPNFAC